jgi:hypothetical protein
MGVAVFLTFVLTFQHDMALSLLLLFPIHCAFGVPQNEFKDTLKNERLNICVTNLKTLEKKLVLRESKSNSNLKEVNQRPGRVAEKQRRGEFLVLVSSTCSFPVPSSPLAIKDPAGCPHAVLAAVLVALARIHNRATQKAAGRRGSRLLLPSSHSSSSSQHPIG